MSVEVPPGGSIMHRTRWRIAAALGGVGDSISTLLPLFALVALDQSVEVAASAGAAYTFGTLAGNFLLWGRLADRVRNPKVQVIAGTALQGAAIIGLGLFPDLASIVVLAVVLGVLSVSMDGALFRLVLAEETGAGRTASVLRFTHWVERGVLVGFGLSAIAMPLLNLGLSDESALRITVVAVGVAVLLESAIALTTLGTRRNVRATAAAVQDLGQSGLVVIWAGSMGPILRVLRLRPGTESTRLDDSVRLLLVSIFVLFAGFALHSGVFAIYLRDQAGLPNGAVMAVFLGGAIATAMAMSRAGSWLVSLAPVQLQVAGAAVRGAVFVGYGVLAIVPDAAWSIAGVSVLYLVSQTAWGLVAPANSARVAAMAPPRRLAEVVSYHSAVAAGGAVVGAVLAGTIAGSVGFEVSFFAAAGVTGIATLLLLRW